MFNRIGHSNNDRNWIFTRDAGNPIIAALISSSPDVYQSYPPCPWKTGADINVLLKRADGTSTANIYGHTSTDGSTFTETGLLFAKSADSGAFDFSAVAPGFYCVETGTHYVFYSGYNGSGAASIGIATAANWGDTFTRLSTTPVWTTADYNSATGDTKFNIYPGCIIKKGSTYHFFGTATDASFTIAAVVYGTGTSLTDYRLDTKLFEATQLTGSGSHSFLQNPDVFCNSDGYFRMILSFGNSGGSTNSKFLVAITSNRKDTPTNFTYSAAEVLRPTAADFENGQVYASSILKDISGTIITVGGDAMLYYSGHSTSATYIGVTCLATKDPLTIP